MTITVADLKTHLNITGTDDDTLLQKLLDAATARIGQFIDPMPTSAAPDLDLAILQLAAFWYESRETGIIGDIVREVPETTFNLIAPYRQWAF